jgi:two-component system LytT family response regulator
LSSCPFKRHNVANGDPTFSRIKVLVVDDEPLARRNVVLLLREDPDIAEVTECSSGAEAIEAVRRAEPDLMFLDVQMPECDGFDVLELLGGAQPRAIVFVTAHDEHALRAFDAGALDYLMKPFDDSRFRRALTRAKERLSLGHQQPRSVVDRLVVKSLGRAIFLKAADIDWIQAASYYACLHVGRDTHILRRTLAELEVDLGADRFIRIHRSVIVNVDRVRGLELDKGGDYEVVLDGEIRLRISRRYRKLLQDRMAAMTRGARQISN